MSLLVQWNDRTYDVDPCEFTQRELHLVEQRTGLNWQGLIVGCVDFRYDAIRALFWVVDQRSQPDLKFSEYDGPPMRVFLEHLAAFHAIAGRLGKLVREVAGTGGSDESPSTVDTPLNNTTP